MNAIKRTIYLVYYIKETDCKQIRTYMNHAKSVTGLSSFRLFFDCINSIYRYNVSIKDYFCFRFYSLNHEERKTWAGTGYMYEYQRIMNPPQYRKILENKISFLQKYKSFVNRRFYTLDEIKNNPSVPSELLNNYQGRMVLKGSYGQVGAEVEVIKCTDFTPAKLISYMTKKNYDLAEEYVIQHPSLMALSSSGLNTVRVFTQISENRVDILGARLRVSVNSPVDNMAAGNLAASINAENGQVEGPAVYSDIRKEERITHPVTGQMLVGFKIPFWDKVMQLAHDAALLYPENKSVGWDIAITETGVELIEGNHNWCKLLWQLPVRKGLKSELEKYL